ncbi:transposase family protein [Streptomyces sp. NPDC020196]|uniref:transposase family protein n=1 Tax=Streptomyces sp. NPDC020196 TaxID=3156656 RepID=UPI0033F6CD59
MEFSTLCDPGKSVPVDASSPSPPSCDQLGPTAELHPGRSRPVGTPRAGPDPRDPRGVRHPLVTVLALTACAVLAGAGSLLAVSEWVADAPAELLERLGIRVGPLFPRHSWPAESTSSRPSGELSRRLPDSLLCASTGQGRPAVACSTADVARWPGGRRGPVLARSPVPTGGGIGSHRADDTTRRRGAPPEALHGPRESGCGRASSLDRSGHPDEGTPRYVQFMCRTS